MHNPTLLQFFHWYYPDGEKQQLLAAADSLRTHNVGILLDVVVNHKMGADEKEHRLVNRVNPDNRDEIGEEMVECEAWTRFSFPARAGKYSKLVWDYKCFSGVDHIENPVRTASSRL